jgi:anti-sigma regulatory factor (Ser/Thr protein kinase)
MGGSRIRIQLTVVPTPEASRQARHMLDVIPDLAPCPDLLFTAQLLTHELITNSVRHGSLSPEQPIRVAVECLEETMRVEVTHAGRCFDPLAELAGQYRRGELYHGLFLLDALADRWGFGSRGVCSLVFEIELVPGRRPWRGREPLAAPRGALVS